MCRLKKAKIKKIKRAALITATSKGYRTGFEGYKPYSDEACDLTVKDLLAYESGYDEGLSASRGVVSERAINAHLNKKYSNQ